MSSNSTTHEYTANAPNSTRNHNGHGRHSNQRRHDNNTSRTGKNAKIPVVGGTEPEELRQMRASHGEHLGTLTELFPNWKEEDLLFVMQEADGELELAIARISDGHASQWAESKPRKKKSESTGKSAASGQQQQYGAPSQWGAGGNGKGGRREFQSDRGDRQRRGQGFRSSGESRPSENEPSGAEVTGGWGDSSYNATETANAVSQSFGGSLSGGWGDEQPDSVGSVGPSGWGGSTQTQSNGWDGPAPAAPSQPQQSSWGSPSKSAEPAVTSWNAPQTQASIENAATPKSNITRTIRSSQPEQSSWGSPRKFAERAATSWTAPQTQTSIDNGGRGASSATPAQQQPKPASTVSKAKGTWAQIVKPAEPPKAPEPKPIAKAPVQQPQRQLSPERRAPSPERRPLSPERSASPERSLSPVRPASPAKDIRDDRPSSPVKSRSVSPIRDRSPIRSPAQPAHSSLVAPLSAAVAIGSPSSADKSSAAKNKLSNQRRALKQDAAVVMPGAGAGLTPASGVSNTSAPSVGVMFGSLSLGISEPQQSRQQQMPAPIAPSGSTSASGPSDSNVQQPMSPNKSQQMDSNPQSVASVQGYQPASGPSQQSAYSTSLKGPQDTYLQQTQTQVPLPQTYGAQQVGHVGTPESLAGPYSSYLAAQQQQHLPSHSQHAQPHVQPAGLGGFGVGPMAGLPADVYGTLYGTDAQRAAAMGYYDPSAYGQTPAAAVSTTYSQGRDVKYNIPEGAPASQGGALAATTTPAQPQAQQAYGVPAANPYYPYYYVLNQFPNAYQQSGYVQPYGNKSMYPVYGAHQQHPSQHQQQGIGKPTPGSPYGAYPTSGSSAGQMYQQSYDEMTSYAQNPAAAHPQPHPVGDFSKGYGSQLPQLPNFLSGQQQSQTSATGMSSAGHHIPKPGDGSVTANSTKASSYGKYNDHSKVGSASNNTSAQQPSQHVQGQQQPQQSQHHPQAQQQQQGSYYPQQYGGYYGQSGYGHPFPQQHHNGQQQGSLQNRGSQQYWGSQS